MKIFISWSGIRTKQLALSLRDWIETILQATEPWVSTLDIDGGSVWFNKITAQLKDAPVGVFCITPENMREPWLVFEAGAIAKGNEANRVCTLLIGLDHTDVQGPLSNFHHTVLGKEGLHDLISGFNKQLEQPLPEKHLEQLFNALWPSIQPSVEAALQMDAITPTKKARAPEDMIKEVLELVRTMSQRLGKLELDAYAGAPPGFGAPPFGAPPGFGGAQAFYPPSQLVPRYYQTGPVASTEDWPSQWDLTELCFGLMRGGLKMEEVLEKLNTMKLDPDIARMACKKAQERLVQPPAHKV